MKCQMALFEARKLLRVTVYVTCGAKKSNQNGDRDSKRQTAKNPNQRFFLFLSYEFTKSLSLYLALGKLTPVLDAKK
jgi:predicted porin